MAKLQRNFIKGRMNKGLDERLIPNGEYIDALNVRVGSTELSEIGVIENSKGNTRLTTLSYVSGTPPVNYILSGSAKCIGAYQDSANERLYWFITDPAHTGPQATGKLDLIVSYNVNDDSVTYHVTSVDDGGGTNTSLNFDSKFLITGVDKVDDMLFFTDNLNQPRMINVTKDYPSPVSNVDDPILAEQLLVIKKPPINSPTFKLTNTGEEQNFLEDRFICFAYRYRYEDDMYSATSQFTNPSFIPKVFDYDSSSNLNEGMENSFDTAEVTINTGSSLVVGIDLLFKEASNPVIRLIEKINKEDLGVGDNQDYIYKFSNNNIYTILDDNEILRLYDNVPLKAKAQTVMGSRLVYGNYLEGYDVDSKNLKYKVNYISENTNITKLQTAFRDGSYNMMGTSLSTRSDSVLYIDFSSVLTPLGNGLKSGGRLNFTIRIIYNTQETSGGGVSLTTTPLTDVTFSYVLNQNYNTIQDLLQSQDFLEKIGTNTSISSISNSCSTGSTLTDALNCAIPNSKVDQATQQDVYSKVGSGISQSIPPQGILDSSVNVPTPVPPPSPTELAIQIPASLFLKDGTTNVFTTEYCFIEFAQVLYEENIEKSSLHSDRNYQTGMIYMDGFNRSTTVLINSENSVYIPCSESINKNKIQVEIPSTQIAPSWATRYKFAIKQDKDVYETIYSNFFFNDENSQFSYILLEGENSQKIEEGDRLKIKIDASGPVLTCIETTVLEKKAQERDFIPNVLDPNTGQNIPIPSGVYMKLKANDFFIGLIQQRSYVTTRSTSSTIDYGINDERSWPRLYLPINYEGFDNQPQFINETLDEGDVINFELRFSRDLQLGFFGCPKREYSLSQEYTVSRTYNSFKDWWEGDNIKDTLGYGTENLGQTSLSFGNGIAPPFISPNAPFNEYFLYDPIDTNSLFNLPFGYPFQIFAPNGDLVPINIFKFFDDSNISGKKALLIRSSSNVCSPFANSIIYASIRITKGTGLVVFETQPQDAAPDIWYESPVSYPITGGFHTGNVQNQTAVQPAIINTEFQNCFSFGNGVESYKIRDSITRSSFGLGNRTSSVLKGDEFKQVRRFADLTYSGIYNYNINNLNEFNLGLLNFKALEPSFGVIQKLFARQTDILVLQEDKISYVLAGKNLLSDSSAGGVITSAPDVLGTQIARMEEYGIGNNPESFAEYGFEKYFTDSKRGVVVQLKGSAYSNEQLAIVSGLGMSSWFRNLFLDNPNTQKLGAYDPYSKEYVLASNQTLLPIKEQIVEAGIKKTVVATVESPVSYTVDLGIFVGDVTLTYNVKDIRNEFLLRVKYNAVNYDTSLTDITTGTATIPKTSVDPQTAVLSVTSVTASANARIELDVQVSRPDSPIVNIIQVCVSDSNESAETIHNEYQWTSGTFVSPLQSQFVSLSEGNDSPLVSQYNKITGPQGGGIVPINGATVEIISKKYQSDNFDFDNTVNNFGYLRSSTLYNNTPTDIAALIAASANVAPTGSGGVFLGSFTMPTSADQYLYLIYDYRKPVAITLCYSNTSADDSCCTCGTSATYYIDAPILQQATAVYTTTALTTKATDGWYSYQGVYRKQTSGVLETSILCSACNLACGTTLSMSTSRGYYTINADLGATTGAVVIDIDFKTQPDGVKVVFNGITYNAVYSPNFGYLNSTGTEPLYAGITAFDCSISGSTFSALSDFQFNGNGFNPTGQVKSVTVNPSSVFLQASGLGTCKMIIPKIAASPSIAEITIISPCDSAEIDIDVFCPVALTAFTTTRNAPEATSVSGLCTSVSPTSFYNVPVGGTAGNPGVGDIIYQDASAVILAESGFYAVVGYPSGSGVIFVDTNGIVTSITACVP